MNSEGSSWSRFGKFNLVGVLGAALQVALLWLLTKHFRVGSPAAAPMAVEIVVLHNFAWHERLTWRDRRPKSMRQRLDRLWRFHVGNGLTSLIGNTVLIYGLVEWIHVPVVPAAIVAIVLCSVVNFFLADRWAFGATGD